jgi:hypothetical protein
VSVVDLDDVVSGVNRSLGGGSEGINGGLDLLLGHGLRNGEILVVGDVRGPVDLLGPSTLLLGGDHSTVDPGGEGRGLASSVGNLDTDLLALGVGEGNDLGVLLLLLIVPETDVLGGDTSLFPPISIWRSESGVKESN